MLDNEAERDDLGDEFARELYGNPGFNNDIQGEFFSVLSNN